MTTETALARMPSRDDPRSYFCDFPAWEPVKAPLYTPTARVKDYVAIVRSDNGAALGVVGADYTIRPHAALAADLDAASAPFGGRANLGPARVSVVGGKVSALVALPRAQASALLTARDPSERAIFLTLRSSHDGKRKETLDAVVMRLACSNGLMLPEFGLQASGKHTQSIVWIESKVRAMAEDLARSTDRLGKTIKGLSEREISRTEMETIVGQIVDPEEKKTRQLEARTTEIIDLILSADGVYVPQAPSSRAFSALQILEAATAYDRHRAPNPRGVTDETELRFRRLDRLVDGDTLGARAYSTLAAML